MTMQAPPPHAAPPPPPAAAPPPPAPAPAVAPAVGAGPVAALTMASQKLQAVIQAATATGGVLPPTAAAEIAAVVQALQGATGGAAAGGAPPQAAPPAGPPAGPPKGPPPGIGKADSVEKVELDEYTATKVTLDAARERMWCVSDAMRDNDMDTAKTELKGVIAMLSALKGDAMKAEATTTVKMDKAGFAAWSSAQFKAMETDEVDVATERLATVKRVAAVAKEAFRTSFEGVAPFTIEMMTAFAPLPEKTEDLTTKTDQSSKETPAVKDTPTVPGSFATNLSEVIKDVQSALTVTTQPEGGAHIGFANDGGFQSAVSGAGGASGTAKSVEKSAGGEGFAWPLDMNKPDAGAGFDVPDDKTVRDADAPDGWGKDPWSNLGK